MAPIRDVYSKRERRAAGVQDVVQYELIDALDTQVIHIWHEAIGDFKRWVAVGPHGRSDRAWDDIERAVAKEHGLYQLISEPKMDTRNACEQLASIPGRDHLARARPDRDLLPVRRQTPAWLGGPR